jgi:DNA-binding NarL/FixJ family response regulator
MERIPILIADEHSQVRAQILVRLEREQDFMIVGTADTSASVIRTANETHPRIVLIDPMMHDGQGLDAIRRLRADLPDVELVVLTAVTDTSQKIELDKLGVRFILNKGIESHKLVDVLHRAAHSRNGNATYTSEDPSHV